LWLRQVHPSVQDAEAALSQIAVSGPPAKPEQRRAVRLWIQSIRRLLVFGGFLGPAETKPRRGVRGWLRDAFGVAIAGAVWLVTWIFPVTFMIVMAWSCETHTRRLFARTLAHYSPNAVIHSFDPRSRAAANRFKLVGVVALGVSIALPIAFLALLIHLGDAALLSWGRALGALVAISLVFGMAIRGSRI
jgi:hypothetical protein